MSISRKGEVVGRGVAIGILLITGGIAIAVIDASRLDEAAQRLTAIGSYLYLGRVVLMGLVALYWQAFLQGLYHWKFLTLSEVAWLTDSQGHRIAFFCVPVSIDTLFQFINYFRF